MDALDERLLALVEELGWQELDIAPDPPDPDWRPDRSELSDGDRKLLGDVERHGWHVVHVHPYAGRDPMWSFTVGLPLTWGHPELVVFGLHADTAHAVLGSAVEAIREGRRYAPGADHDDVLEEHPVRFVPVRRHWYASFLGYAQWFHESDGGFDVLQLVWPDREGRWPWDPACSLPPGTQPLLGA